MFRSWRRFLADRSGNYGPIFAILSVPLMGSVAASVEYSRAIEAKADLQHALDAAALATAKEISVTTDSQYLAAYARDYFDANLGDALDTAKVSFGYSMVPSEAGGNVVKLTAAYDFDTYLGKFVGTEEIELDLTAEVSAGNKTAEIAIVIDNSGSMDTLTGGTTESRMVKAKEAAAAMINSLFTVAALSNKADPIRVAVVPFAGSVNVGSKYRGASWLDMNGWSSIHHENLDWTGTNAGTDVWPGAIATGGGYKSATTSTVSVGPNPPDPLPTGVVSYTSTWLTRWTLLDAIGADWAGCVEMRPWPYHANDDAASDVAPDSLFVPMFAPDEPERQVSGEDNDYRNQYLRDYVRVGPDITVTSANSGTYTKQGYRQSWTRKYNTDALTKLSSGAVKMGTERSRDMGSYGPNQGCTTDAIQELTTDQATVLAAIDAMDAGGYTNVQEGIAWGWRVLSAGEPFAQGRAYSEPENQKYLIVLTDGNNTYPGQSTNNETEFYSWGYGKHDRVMDNATSAYSNTNAMDIHTAATCANIKALANAEGGEAIRIFTIAYDVPDGSSVKSLLYDCASASPDGGKYYYDVSGDAIADAMAAIGNEISDLRISK
jgi:Flp pilus assembly protein TadG